MECLFLGTMSGPCWDHVWPSFTSRPAIAMKFSKLNINGLRPISMECLFFGTMSGPCWDHVWPSFTFKQARAHKFSGLSQHGLRPMSIEYLFLRIMLGPYLAQLYFPTRLRFLRLVLSICLVSILFLGSYQFMFGPCQDHAWPSFTSRPTGALNFLQLNQHGPRPMSMECLLP